MSQQIPPELQKQIAFLAGPLLADIKQNDALNTPSAELRTFKTDLNKMFSMGNEGHIPAEIDNAIKIQSFTDIGSAAPASTDSPLIPFTSTHTDLTPHNIQPIYTSPPPKDDGDQLLLEFDKKFTHQDIVNILLDIKDRLKIIEKTLKIEDYGRAI